MARVVGVRRYGRSWAAAGVAGLLLAATIAVSAPTGTGRAAADYVPLPTSIRLVDTRPGGVTYDGLDAGIGRRLAGSTLEVVVAGRAGVPLDAEAAVLTVTAVDSGATGFLTVHPTGAALPTASNVNFYPDHNTAGAAFARIGTGGKVSVYTSASTQLIVDVAGYFPPGAYNPLANPTRLADTRPGGTTTDGQSAGIGLRAADSTFELQVAGRGGVPIDADVAVLTVTAVDEPDAGFLTVHATGAALPTASNVNFHSNHNIANTVVAPIGTGGKVSIYTSAPTHLIVDVAGHLPAGSYVPLPNSARLADTRPGGTTTDGTLAGGGIVGSGYTLQVPVAGRAGVPADASSVVLNVAAVDPADVGFSTVHPNGTARPNASNVNYYVDHNTASTVVARIGAGGDVCVFASAATQLIVDVAGYFTGPPAPGAGPACPEAPPVPAIWPAENVVFATPELAAADFVTEVFSVDPLFGSFVGAARAGSMEVWFPGDDEDPSTSFPTGSVLQLRRLGPHDGWFVTGATSVGVSITSPATMAVVAEGPVTVEGLGRGFEANVVSWAFVAGMAARLDLDFTNTDWITPTPYTMSLDLGAASPGDVVGLIVRGDTGLGNTTSEFAARPVLIGS